MRQEFAAQWDKLTQPAMEGEQTTTVSLTQRHFPKYLNYFWELNDDNKLQANPIKINPKTVTCYLNPADGLPTQLPIINGNSFLIDTTMNLLIADIAVPPELEINNNANADLDIVITGAELDRNIWKDMYVLLDYSVDI